MLIKLGPLSFDSRVLNLADNFCAKVLHVN